MRLNKENIEEWKIQLNKEALKIDFKEFEETLSNEQWLNDYENWTPEDVLTEECFYCCN